MSSKSTWRKHRLAMEGDWHCNTPDCKNYGENFNFANRATCSQCSAERFDASHVYASRKSVSLDAMGAKPMPDDALKPMVIVRLKQAMKLESKDLAEEPCNSVFKENGLRILERIKTKKILSQHYQSLVDDKTEEDMDDWSQSQIARQKASKRFVLR
jgi:hypothetical protein